MSSLVKLTVLKWFYHHPISLYSKSYSPQLVVWKPRTPARMKQSNFCASVQLQASQWEPLDFQLFDLVFIYAYIYIYMYMLYAYQLLARNVSKTMVCLTWWISDSVLVTLDWDSYIFVGGVRQWIVECNGKLCAWFGCGTTADIQQGASLQFKWIVNAGFLLRTGCKLIKHISNVRRAGTEGDTHALGIILGNLLLLCARNRIVMLHNAHSLTHEVQMRIEFIRSLWR